MKAVQSLTDMNLFVNTFVPLRLIASHESLFSALLEGAR